MSPGLPKALDEDFLKGPPVQPVCLFVQDPVSHGGIHLENELERLVIIDLNRLHTRIVLPVALIREVLFLESACGKFTVAPPRRALSKYFPEPFPILRRLQRAVEEQLIHNSAAQEDLTRCVERCFLSPGDIGEIRR